MLDDEVPSDRRLARQLDPVEHLRVEAQHMVKKGQGHAHKARPDAVAPAPVAVDDESPESTPRPIPLMIAPVLADVRKHRPLAFLARLLSAPGPGGRD